MGSGNPRHILRHRLAGHGYRQQTDLFLVKYDSCHHILEDSIAAIGRILYRIGGL